MKPKHELSLFTKIVGSAVALVLIFAGGVDFTLTTWPGLLMLGFIWGFDL